jgi:hypothetical protein
MFLRKEKHNVTMFICTAHYIPFYATDRQCYVHTYGTMSLPSQRRRQLLSGSVVQDLVLLCSTQSSDQETQNCDHEEVIQLCTHARTNSPTGQTKTLFVNLKLQTSLRWGVQWSHLYIRSAQGVWPSCYSSEGKGESVPVTAMKTYREQRYRIYYVKSG